MALGGAFALHESLPALISAADIGSGNQPQAGAMRCD